MPISGGGAGNAFIASGSYVGDSTVNRAIAHTLGTKPRIVFIDDATFSFMNLIDTKIITLIGAETITAVTAKDATNFYVSGVTGANNTGVTYYWVAIL